MRPRNITASTEDGHVRMYPTDLVLGYDPHELDRVGAAGMAQEIAQQPAVWREVARQAATHGSRHQTFLRPLVSRPEMRIVLAGAGTSAYAGQLLAPTLRRRLGRRVDAIASTDLVADPRGCLAEDVPTLLVSFSRSGDSPEALAATELADSLISECYHLVVTCNRDGRLYHAHADADRSLMLSLPEAANDRAFAMTSSLTSMALATLLAFDPRGTGIQTAERLTAATQALLPEFADCGRALAEMGYDRFVYLGSGALHGLAQESALKLLELSAGQVFTYADSCLGFRHGPKAVLNERTLAVVYVSSDPYTRRYDMDLVHELRGSIGPANVLALGAEGPPDESTGQPLGGDAWVLPGLDGLDDSALALCLVLLAQVIALHTSLELGLRPDNPFPSQEVNRVVQGVAIHPFR